MQTTKINISICEDDWMPFRDAPLDGRIILVRDDDGSADLCRWSELLHEWIYEFGNGELPVEFALIAISQGENQ